MGEQDPLRFAGCSRAKADEGGIYFFEFFLPRRLTFHAGSFESKVAKLFRAGHDAVEVQGFHQRILFGSGSLRRNRNKARVRP